MLIVSLLKKKIIKKSVFDLFSGARGAFFPLNVNPDSHSLHWVITSGNLMPEKILFSVFQMNPLGLGKGAVENVCLTDC